VHRESFDFVGFITLSLAVGALQLLLDRGELKDWFHSTEIWIEAIVTGLGFYLFTVHTATTSDRSFLSRDLLTNTTFMVGTVLMFVVGLIMSATLALLPSMLENLMNYPALTTGLVTVPRGLGSMIAMFVVARVIDRVDPRMLVLVGLLLTAISMWQMCGFSLQMGMTPVITTGLLQGFGLGCTFVPLNLVALSTLPRHILTQGTAIRSLMRNLGGSIGISLLVAALAENTQIIHSRLVEGLRLDNPLLHTPLMGPAYSLTAPSGVAALNAEVTRQAAMIAYIDDFWLLMVLSLLSIPLLLLLREARSAPVVAGTPLAQAAAADD
jgi:DHA2 family multidrug resistance protein